MPVIVSATTGFPEHYYPQHTLLTAILLEVFAGRRKFHPRLAGPVFGVANSLLLRARIRGEEQALAE